MPECDLLRPRRSPAEGIDCRLSGLRQGMSTRLTIVTQTRMRAVLVAAVMLFAIGASHCEGALTQAQSAPESATELVQELKRFRPALPATPPRGELLLEEEWRKAVYDRLWSMAEAAMPALVAGLDDSDPRVRRNVALFLNVAGGRWYEPERERLDIRPSLSALVRALEDDDSRVRGLSAQAIGTIGEPAAPAVPALTRLLDSAVEGDRLSACSALASIGPHARAGLAALRAAVSDSSAVVSGCARGAILRIER